MRITVFTGGDQALADGDKIMAFTTDNTEGYTDAELAALNAEMALKLALLPHDDTDARAAAEKAFHNEVAGR